MLRFPLLVFIFVCCLFTNLSAKDKIIYGFQRLSIHDYFQARETFLSAIRKEPVAAYYGLSIIAARNNNPFYNLDSARTYILSADTFFHHLTPEEELRLNNKYHIVSFHIVSCKDSIARLAYEEAVKNASTGAWNAFIEKYSWSALSDSAIAERNNLAFLAAKKENTSKSYKDFFTTYPYSMQSPEARKRYEDRLFREQTSQGTEAAFAGFINTYPDSPYRMQAEDSLFSIATRQKTPEAYYAFAKKYPANRNTSSAWMKLYNRYLEIHRVSDLSDFFTRYPDFKFRRQVEEDFRLANVELLPTRKNNRFTFITEEGKALLQGSYDDVDEFSEGLCAVNKNGKYGYISKGGKLEINFQFDEADPFENGFALVKINGKEAAINRDGELIVPAIYEELGSPHDERILFLDASSRYGYLDMHGKIVIAPVFEYAGDFSGGMAVAGKEDSLGLIDRNGHWIVAPKYSSVSIEQNGLVRVGLDDQFGFLNRLGDEVLPVTYDAIGKFSSGLAIVVQDGRYGYVDGTGRIIIPLQFDFEQQAIVRSEFNNGFAEVRQKAKSALIDSLGNKVIPALYDELNFNVQALPVAARKKTKWGYIDFENKTVIPFRFDAASVFSENTAVVKTAKSFGAIDTEGQTVIPFEYDFISQMKNGTAVIKKGGLSGLISKDASVLVEPEFEKYQFVTDKIIRFDRNNKFGYYNTAKKEWIWKEDGL